jgi:hypothetical protein
MTLQENASFKQAIRMDTGSKMEEAEMKVKRLLKDGAPAAKGLNEHCGGCE